MMIKTAGNIAHIYLCIYNSFVPLAANNMGKSCCVSYFVFHLWFLEQV